MEQLRAILCILGSGLALAGLPGMARAQSESTTMTIGAEVAESCSIAATTMAFPITTPGGGGNATATADITLNCSPGVDYDIAMDNGLHPQGQTRNMFDPVLGTYLPYEVYRNAKMTAQWGDRTGINTVAGRSRRGGATVITAYGKIKSTTQTARSGKYSDYVVVTVNF